MRDQVHLALGNELHTVIAELMREARAKDELPANHAAALGHLDGSGPATIAGLAQACHIRHQSMTAIVHHMAALGEVTAQPHPTDRRAVLYRLTEQGRTDLERDRRVRAKWLAESIESRFGSCLEDVEEAIRVLRRLQNRAMAPGQP